MRQLLPQVLGHVLGQAKPIAAVISEKRLDAIKLLGSGLEKSDALGFQFLIRLVAVIPFLTKP
jgi:hypothetical protein